MNTSPPIRVDVPVCAFRPYPSREYQDTFPIPTPSSVYGMLLSLVGEPGSPSATQAERHEAKIKHRGVEMALAVDRLPGQSKVFRKLRRGSDLEDTRPDYQDLLMDLRLWLWLRRGPDPAEPPLAERVIDALRCPESISRFGGLSLGESSYLVDSISVQQTAPDRLVFLIPDRAGFYSLPVWVDHTDARNTILVRFRLSEPASPDTELQSAWFRIGVAP